MYPSVSFTFGTTPVQAQVGLQGILGHCGHRTDTQKIDIVLAKRVCVTQNTDYIIMLLMSVCQYDLDCQRLLSGIIACTTFRRLCAFLSPIRFKHFWTAHAVRGGGVSIPFFAPSLPLIFPSNLSIPFSFYENCHIHSPRSPAASEVPASRQSLPQGV